MAIASVTILLGISFINKINIGIKNPWVDAPLNKRYKKILKNHLRYYQSMNGKDKKIFERNVQKVIRNHTFIIEFPKTWWDTMKALVAGIMVQYNLYDSGFEKIIIGTNDHGYKKDASALIINAGKLDEINYHDLINTISKTLKKQL